MKYSVYRIGPSLGLGLMLAGCAVGSHWRAYAGPELPASQIAVLTRDEPRITRDRSPESQEVAVFKLCGRDVVRESGGFLPFQIDIKPERCEVTVHYTELVKTPGIEALVGVQARTRAKRTSFPVNFEAGAQYRLTSNYNYDRLEIYLDVTKSGKTTRLVTPSASEFHNTAR